MDKRLKLANLVIAAALFGACGQPEPAKHAAPPCACQCEACECFEDGTCLCEGCVCCEAQKDRDGTARGGDGHDGRDDGCGPGGCAEPVGG